jgi:hypothetical protein
MPFSPKSAATTLQKLQGTHDPAVDRHKDSLFGKPAEPLNDYTQPGHVRMEWIGDYSPHGVARIRSAIQLGMIPKHVIKAYDDADAKMTTRIAGLTHHTMDNERDGLSQSYTWGPWEFVIEVRNEDADKILSGTFGHQFRVHGYDGKQPSDYDPIDRFVAPHVDAETTAKVRAIVTDEGREEALTGVVPGGRMGAWTPKG